ncbi:hypothetical protein B484DRAFT_396710 [Ochromonadaceae sp. CCMP2298]|nr:hypothetical protein B484DRAFT_396710 [Ochromonadaceae sp. CCMP2298]
MINLGHSLFSWSGGVTEKKDVSDSSTTITDAESSTSRTSTKALPDETTRPTRATSSTSTAPASEEAEDDFEMGFVDLDNDAVLDLDVATPLQEAPHQEEERVEVEEELKPCIRSRSVSAAVALTDFGKFKAAEAAALNAIVNAALNAEITLDTLRRQGIAPRERSASATSRVGFSDDVEEILIPTVREVKLAGLGVKLWCSSDELMKYRESAKTELASFVRKGKGVSRTADFKEALRCMLLQDDEQEVKGGKGVEVKTRPKLSASTSTPGF